MIVSLGSILGVVIISAMAAYRIQRVGTVSTEPLYQVFVASMTILPAVMLPLLKFMSMLQLNNTRTGLTSAITVLGVALAVFLYHGFLKSVPRSIEEAAIVDGCSAFGVFRRIVFPLLRPTTITLVVLDVCGFGTIICCRPSCWGSKKGKTVRSRSRSASCLTSSIPGGSGYGGDYACDRTGPDHLHCVPKIHSDGESPPAL